MRRLRRFLLAHPSTGFDNTSAIAEDTKHPDVLLQVSKPYACSLYLKTSGWQGSELPNSPTGVIRVMVFPGASVQHMERRYQALAPDLSRTCQDHQAQGEGLIRNLQGFVRHMQRIP